jgi:type III secretory pathway component EscR
MEAAMTSASKFSMVTSIIRGALGLQLKIHTFWDQA